jgi:hypothetical protein
MPAPPGGPSCRLHDWERRLEFHRGVECVVRVCRRCARKELCWSRRPLSLEPDPRRDSRKDERGCCRQ